MANEQIHITVFQGGNFTRSHNPRRCFYVGGKSSHYNFDPDLLSYMDLVQYFKEDFDIPDTEFIKIFYKIPDVDLCDDMGAIRDDSEVVEMVECAKKDQGLEIYIIQDYGGPSQFQPTQYSHVREEIQDYEDDFYENEDYFSSISEDEGEFYEEEEEIDVPLKDIEFGAFDPNMLDISIDEGRLDLMVSPMDSGPYASSDDKNSDEDNVYDIGNPQIKEGIIFRDVKVYRLALQQYAVKNAYDFHYIKNDPVRVTVDCATQGCNWRCHASRNKNEDTFKIKRVRGEHTCPASNASKSASAKMISNWIESMIKNNMHRSIASLRRALFTEFGVHVKYKKVERARAIAFERLRGSYELSFTLVPKFCNAILHYNPGSTACYKVQEDGAFQRLYISFNACKVGFANGCRPFLGLDGCHLTGKYKGILLAATALDGNNGLFPYAIGVVEAENRDSWTWFLDKMSLTLGHESQIVFLSDRQKGVIEAVIDIFPYASHHFCVRHIYANFKKEHSGYNLKEAFWKAANAYTLQEYEAAMALLRSLSTQAHGWLSKISPTSWSKSHFDTDTKIDILCNNLSESFNAWISDVRDLPIVEMIDTIRQKVMVSMRKRHEDSLKMTEKLAPKVRKRLDVICQSTRGLSLLRSGEFEWEVTDVGFTLVITRNRVLLDKRSCSCRRWDLSGIPCKHAIACIMTIRGNLEDYCHVYYHIDSLREAYKEAIHGLPDERLWPQVNINPVYPPHSRRPPGRPKKNRVRDADEPRSSQTRRPKHCQRCGRIGHNKSTCKAPLRGGPSRTTSRGQDSIGLTTGSTDRGHGSRGRGSCHIGRGSTATSSTGRGQGFEDRGSCHMGRGSTATGSTSRGQGSSNRGGRCSMFDVFR